MYSMKKISLLCAGLLCTNLINGNLGYSAEHSLLGDSISDLEVKNIAEYKNPFTLFNTSLINRTFNQYIYNGVNSIVKCGLLGNFSSEESSNILNKFASSFTNRRYNFKYDDQMTKERDYRYFSNKQSDFAEYELECLNAILKDESVCAENLLYIYTKPIEQNNFDYEDIKLLMQLTSALVYKLDINDLVKLISLVDNYRNGSLSFAKTNYVMQYLLDLEYMLFLSGFSSINQKYISKDSVPDAVFDLIGLYSGLGIYNNETYDGYISSACKNIFSKITRGVIDAANAKQYSLIVLRDIARGENWNSLFSRYFHDKEQFNRVAYASAGNFAINNGYSSINFYKNSSNDISFIDFGKCNSGIEAYYSESNNWRRYNRENNNEDIVNFVTKIHNFVKKRGKYFSKEDALCYYIFNEDTSDHKNVLQRVGIVGGKTLTPNGMKKIYAFVGDNSRVDNLTSSIDFVRCLYDEAVNIDCSSSVLSVRRDTWENILKQYNKKWMNTQRGIGRVDQVFENIFRKCMVSLNSLFKAGDASHLEEVIFDKDNIIKFLNKFLGMSGKLGMDDNEILNMMKGTLTYRNLIDIFAEVLKSLCEVNEFSISSSSDTIFYNSCLDGIVKVYENISSMLLSNVTTFLVDEMLKFLDQQEFDCTDISKDRIVNNLNNYIRQYIGELCHNKYTNSNRELNENEYVTKFRSVFMLDELYNHMNNIHNVCNRYFTNLFEGVDSNLLTTRLSELFQLIKINSRVNKFSTFLNRNLEPDLQILHNIFFDCRELKTEAIDSCIQYDGILMSFIQAIGYNLNIGSKYDYRKEFADAVTNKVNSTNNLKYCITCAYENMIIILNNLNINTERFIKYKARIINTMVNCGYSKEKCSQFDMFFSFCTVVLEKIMSQHINEGQDNNDVPCILSENDFLQVLFYSNLIEEYIAEKGEDNGDVSTGVKSLYYNEYSSLLLSKDVIQNSLFQVCATDSAV